MKKFGEDIIQYFSIDFLDIETAIKCVLTDAQPDKKNSVLLCIDEFTKSVPDHQLKLITSLGYVLKVLGDKFNLLISTLDAVLMNKSVTKSNRKVEYIPLPPFSPKYCMNVLSIDLKNRILI